MAHERETSVGWFPLSPLSPPLFSQLDVFVFLLRLLFSVQLCLLLAATSFGCQARGEKRERKNIRTLSGSAPC